MTRVSSANSTFVNSHTPSLNAASTSARLVRLFDPGGVTLAEKGAAILLPQHELSPEKLSTLLRSLDRKKLLEMAGKARDLGKRDATRVVADRCVEMAR